MGTSTFANYSVVPEIALARIREDAPFDKVCYIGCGVTTGIGAVINTAKGGAGRATWWCSASGGIGLNVVQGARLAGANMIVGVDLNPARRALAQKFGMTHFVNPKDMSEAELVPYLVNLTKGGADYSFECIGNVKVMRQALECCHKGWGVSVIIGVAGAGQEISDAPVPARHRPRVEGHGVRRRARAAPTCRGSSTGTWTERSTSTTCITHTLQARRHQPGLRPHALGRIDPCGCRLLNGLGHCRCKISA